MTLFVMECLKLVKGTVVSLFYKTAAEGVQQLKALKALNLWI
jgi:hypothetical protein